jgi:pyridoxal phosphate enzyme (YggS family)
VTYDLSSVEVSLSRLQEHIALACSRVGRDPSDVTLVGASKRVSAPILRVFASAGLRVTGENYVQEAVAKRAELTDVPLEWHLIGALQRNKARQVVEFALLHGIGSESVARAVDIAARERGKTQRVLLQVNISEESSKSGVAPGEVLALANAVAQLSNVQLCGLMCLPPYSPDVEAARPHFRRLRGLRDELLRSHASCRELSMGMSNDFEVAIEEGATLVRIGTALFGARD